MSIFNFQWRTHPTILNAPPVNDHTFDIVTFDKEMLPSWESATIEQVCDKLKVSQDEITMLGEDDKKLTKEIIARTQLILHHKEITGKKL